MNWLIKILFCATFQQKSPEHDQFHWNSLTTNLQSIEEAMKTKTTNFMKWMSIIWSSSMNLPYMAYVIVGFGTFRYNARLVDSKTNVLSVFTMCSGKFMHLCTPVIITLGRIVATNRFCNAKIAFHIDLFAHGFLSNYFSLVMEPKKQSNKKFEIVWFNIYSKNTSWNPP